MLVAMVTNEIDSYLVPNTQISYQTNSELVYATPTFTRSWEWKSNGYFFVTIVTYRPIASPHSVRLTNNAHVYLKNPDDSFENFTLDGTLTVENGCLLSGEGTKELRVSQLINQGT